MLQIYYKYNIDEDNEPFPEVNIHTRCPPVQKPDSSAIYSFLQGFRMMGGQPLARTYDPPPGIKEYTYYDCLDGGTVSRCVDDGVCPSLMSSLQNLKSC